MRRTTSIRLITVLITVLASIADTSAAGPKMKYPGGKYYIWRYTLKDKQGTPFSIDHPTRWLSHKSIERRRRQGLAIDSTDLPVSNLYLKAIEMLDNFPYYFSLDQSVLTQVKETVWHQ